MIPRGHKVGGIRKVAAENSWSAGQRRLTTLGFREKFMGNSGVPQAISRRYAPSTARSRLLARGAGSRVKSAVEFSIVLPAGR